jgi:hypothetical protein
MPMEDWQVGPAFPRGKSPRDWSVASRSPSRPPRGESGRTADSQGFTKLRENRETILKPAGVRTRPDLPLIPLFMCPDN